MINHQAAFVLYLMKSQSFLQKNEKFQKVKYQSIFSPSFSDLLYYKITIFSIRFHQVAGSSPKGRGKGAMLKGGCFLPLKTQKALENQGL